MAFSFRPTSLSFICTEYNKLYGQMQALNFLRSCKSFVNLVLLCLVVLFVAPDCGEVVGVASV